MKNLHKVYSKIEKDKLLHSVFFNPFYFNGEIKRFDLSPESEFLQVAYLYLPKKGHKFKAHQHNRQIRKITTTQECWAVIKGRIKVSFYDLDKSFLEDIILNEGDVSITYFCGHNYTVEEDNSVVYECKQGPYLGQLRDKELIEEKSIPFMQKTKSTSQKILRTVIVSSKIEGHKSNITAKQISNRQKVEVSNKK